MTDPTNAPAASELSVSVDGLYNELVQSDARGRATIASQAAEIEQYLEQIQHHRSGALHLDFQVLAKQCNEALERAERAEAALDAIRSERDALRARRIGLCAFAREANFMCEHGVQAREDLVCRWCTEAALATERERTALARREALEVIQQAIDCIRGETPEDCSVEEARDDTIAKLRALIGDASAEPGDSR